MTILENLQQRKLGKMEGRHTIVPTLFTILSLCLELPATDQGSTEYIKQLLLTTILNICDHLGDTDAEEAGPLITEEQFSVELVVQCIRTSDNPQTHNHALLLLATAAKLFPEHVLHNIMAIFTFMGASLLRQDDSHSFQIIHKTVQTVIPALVKASKDQSLPSSLAGNLEDVVTMVMQTFVDAFPHIPEHRRLPLFTHLVQSVGGMEYLWRVILLLIGGYATKGATAMLPEETETKGPGRNLEFWLTLCHHFDPDVQVISLTKMLGYLATLKGKKEGVVKTPSRYSRSSRSAGLTPGSKGTTQDLIFDQESHSPRQLRHFKFTSVGFLSQLLTSDPFIAQLVNLSEEKSASMQALYQKLLEQTLCYITHVAHCIQDNADPNTAKFWRALLHKAYDVLDKVNYLLPAKVFIGVVSGLIGNRLPTVRRKAMELLNNKLIQNKDGFEEEETAMLLGMLDTLVAIAKSSRENQAEADELDINRQTALYSLKLLCKLFGSEHRKEFTKVMDVALGIIMETHGNNQVIASGLLCLAEAVSSLKAHAIPYLSRFMPPLLDTLASKTHVTSSDLHLLSTVTAIQKILETLPHFLSPYLGQLLQQVCRLSGYRQDEEKSQLTLRLKACRHQLSSALPPRVLIPAVSECYKTNVSTSKDPCNVSYKVTCEETEETLKLLSYAIGQTVEDQHRPLMSILNEHLTSYPGGSLEPPSCYGQLLSYNHWTSRIPAMVSTRCDLRRDRKRLFKLLSYAMDRDGLEGSVSVRVAASRSPLVYLRNKNKPFFEEDTQSKEKSASLLGYALDCLHKCFHYDKGDFVSKERFEKLMQPLVDQIENTQGGDDIYEARITSHLTPCIVQFMVAAKDPSTWQPLNYQILLKTRNSSPKVRYAALTVLQAVHSQLGEDYLSLLPETIPFLAELMEDESEEVEQHCQDVVSELEKTLGEPLQKYF
eukprot:XP_011680875.1 PREDICTED: HEAT repeat-containing protein 1 [Strongylocentrotus purpuratus]